MGFSGSNRALPSYYWVLLVSYGCSTEFYLVLPSFTESNWVLLDLKKKSKKEKEKEKISLKKIIIKRQKKRKTSSDIPRQRPSRMSAPTFLSAVVD